MNDLQTLPLPQLFAELAAAGRIRRLLELARDEDLADAGDITAEVMNTRDETASFVVRAREAGVVAGLEAIPMILDVFGGGVSCECEARDGASVAPGDTLAALRGPTRTVVTAERTILNLVGRLSGVATRTAMFVERVRGTKAQIVDTRKTTPGLRELEKYAVRCGGGASHRLGLYDAVLIKDNHIASIPLDRLAARLTEAASRARTAHAPRFVEVEVDTLDQLAQALAVEPGLIDFVLLDNMAPETLRDAMAMRDRENPALLLEASGGVTLDTVRAIAETGVDRISVGGLTHRAVSLDVGLDAV